MCFVFHRYHLQIGNDGSYKPITGYNHHVHPKPHPTFDKVPETFQKSEKDIPKISKNGLFKSDLDVFERKPFYVHSPTVCTLPLH